MILVDTSVWVDHLRSGEPLLAGLLMNGQAVCHPFIIGELALGNLSDRADILADMENLPIAPLAADEEVRRLIDQHGLAGSGIGYLDAHLAASAKLGALQGLWTRDRRLARVLDRLGLAVDFA
ncbi:type II toxin-antitoxin system VapC family toxin [Glycocaulis sp.]|uniref:type II toxin-antitoxin system VapC family toxin n=1 Tax=Glycocaulis sp. TaxID=1969725 RepID=UPI003F6FFCF8